MSESNTPEPKMNCRSESNSESSDEPLFVLKYRRGEVIKRLILVLFLIMPLVWWISQHWNLHGPKETLWLIWVSFALFHLSFLFMDILLFRQVALYKTKIVKTWHFVGKIQIKLADAQLRCRAGYKIYTGIFDSGPFNRWMRIYDRRTNVALSYIKAVCYDEKLADPEDVKKLNTLLADLTGRKVEELEQPRIRIDRLIEQGER
jgi:hypothetical protein